MKLRIAPLTLAFLGCATLAQAKVSVGNGGISVSGTGADSYLFKYPQLINAAQKPAAKLMDTTVSGSKAQLKYDDGTLAEVTVSGDQVRFQFTKGSAAVKTFKLDSQLGFNMLGAKWQVDARPAEAIPEAKPPKPHLYQGPARSFEFIYISGATLSADLPSGTYVQLTDCREWGWKNYNLSFGVPLQSSVALSFHATGPKQSAGEPSKSVLTDKFGQYALKDWPGKIKSEEELKADAQREAAFYAAYRPPELDRFGGLPGSKEKFGFKQTGFFHVEKKGDRWYLVNPDGNWHFYLGVCSFATYPNNVQPKGRENTYEWLPQFESEFKPAFGQNGGGNNDGKFNFYIANRIRKYGEGFDVKQFTEQMIGRVRKFGFNSAGAFGSGDRSAREAMNFPYVAELPVRTWQGVPHLPGLRETWDPFDEAVRAKVESKLQKLPANDPLVIGWYLVNEPLYEDIPRVVPGYKQDKACKRRLVQMLEEKYKTVEAFNKAWGTGLASFDEAAKQGLPVKTKEAAADMEAFKELFLEEYFKFISETARKYDPNHMLMGCRFQSGTINNEAVCRIGSKYMDVWSFNYYTYGLDEQFLGKIQKWVGDKPMILSEFHFNSNSDSGVLGGAKDVSSQEERGLAYRHYVEQAASLPYIVGVEWYTLIDGAVAGFNANCGLFNVVDRPWKKMVDEMVKTNYEIYNLAEGKKQRFVHTDPKFSGKGKGGRVMIADRVTTPLNIDGQGGDWPGVPAERIGGAGHLVQGSAAGSFEGAVKVCWNDEYLYVIADIADDTPMMNRREARDLWNGDAVEIFAGSEELEKGGQPLFTDRHLLLSAALTGDKYYYSNSPEQYECKVAVASKATGGYTLEAAIPWKALSVKPEPNRELLFDIALNDSADGNRRDKQLMWSGTAKNSGDRTHWGRLRLVVSK